MEKMIITKEQENHINKMIDIGIEEGLSENQAKGRVLEIHIQRGWDDTGLESLNSLTADEMGRVLFSGYEVSLEKLSLQKYRVSFSVQKFIEIANIVLCRNEVELTEDQVVDMALSNIKKLFPEVELEKEALIYIDVLEKVKAEKEESEKKIENNLEKTAEKTY